MSTKVDPKKKTRFCYRKIYSVNVNIHVDKYIEDVKQDEKHVPDLLESILSPTFFVKESLRLILFKMNRFVSTIQKIKVSTFWIL